MILHRLLPLLLLGALAAPLSAAPDASLSTLVDTTKITGARIDETVIKTLIHVNPRQPARPGAPRGSAANPSATIGEGLQLAHAQLAAGTPVKVLIHPGTYREAAPALDWSQGPARDTTLVIEATKPGAVIWSGADVFTAWTKTGEGLYTHAWPYQFGNYSPRWGAKKVIGHRTEMVFVDGRPLYPRLLETYAVKGAEYFGKSVISWDYTGAVNPQAVLTAGSFGINERPENGPKLTIRLPEAQQKPEQHQIEVSVRQKLVDFGSKRNLVLRGLVFEKTANSLRNVETEGPVTFAHFDATNQPAELRDAIAPRNILIDDCQFLWNSGTALKIIGFDWTVRNSVFNYNGYSGISTGKVSNLRFERNTTNFNVWRGKMAGENGWFTAGFKAHFAQGHVVLGHTAIGNQTGGIGWDIHCNDIYLQDVVSVDNHAHTVLWELSRGPFHGRRILGANIHVTGSGFLIYNNSQSLLEDSLLVTNGGTYGNGMDSLTTTQALWLHNSNRKDPHALMHPLPELGYEVRNTVITSTATTGPLIRENSWREPATTYVLEYAGKDNILWGGNPQQRAYSAARRDATDKAPRNFDAKAWAARHGEENLQEVAPQLRDPANYDFRFAPDSPLAARAKQLPSIQISKKDQADRARFLAWMQAAPPAQEHPAAQPSATVDLAP